MRPLLKKLIGDQRGALLAEVLVAISVFTLLGSAVMTSVSATSAAASTMRLNAEADTVASNQMTAMLSGPYQDPPYTYTPIAHPPEFAVTAVAQEYIVGDPFIEKLVVTVSMNGNTITTLESLRMKTE